jgi:predicted RNase H-like nuclease (RuvC/YqgF family)
MNARIKEQRKEIDKLTLELEDKYSEIDKLKLEYETVRASGMQET